MQNRELLDEVRELRKEIHAQVSTGTGISPPAQRAEAPVANAGTDIAGEQQEAQAHRLEELAQTKVEASQRFPVQLTGTVLFNAFLNGASGGGAQNPVAASATPGTRNDGASLRQTVLGLTFQGPQTFLGGAISGSLYMDFFGGTGTSLNQLLRLRLATMQVDWAHGLSLAVGQDKPIVSLREPNSLAQVGVSPLTAAGNPWLWQPQARLQEKFSVTSKTSLKATAGIYETAEERGNVQYAAGSRPAFQTRVGVRHEFDDERLLEVAGVFHRSETHVEGQSISSRLYGIDLLAKPFAKIEITGFLFKGQNFANLGALGGLSELPSGEYVPIHGSGGWLQLRYLATKKLSFNLYGGAQDDRNRDLTAGQIGRNTYLAANAMYLLGPNVVAAFEFGQARTNYLGLGERLNPHYDLALAYSF